MNSAKKRKAGLTGQGLMTAIRQRKLRPIVLSLPVATLWTIAARDLETLQVDHTYQRREEKTWIYTLAEALQNGGQLPEPATVVKRPDGSLMLVDGQQRRAACILADKDLPVRVYDLSKSHDHLDQERALYSTLNHHKSDRANHIVEAHPGVVAEMLRRSDATPGSHLYGLVNFGSGSHKTRPFSASVLVRCIARVAYGAGKGNVTGSTHDAINTADMLYQKVGVAQKVDAFFWTLAKAYRNGAPAYHVIQEMAVHAGRLWLDKPPCIASPATIEKLQRIAWLNVSPGPRFRSKVGEVLATKWK